MDFTLDENQQAAADLSNQIFGDRISPEGLKNMEESGGWFDRDTYAEITKAGLLGIACKEDVGGGGLGLVELGQVLEAQGRHVAPVPLWSTSLAALAIDEFGSKAQRKAELPGLLAGTSIYTTGIQEWFNDNLVEPEAEAAPDGDGFKITGTKIVVEFAEESEKMLVTARSPEGEAMLYLVDLKQGGISMNPGVSTRLQPVHEVVMSGAPGEALSGSSSKWLVNRAIALLCATQVGVLGQALKITAEYTSTREQFGRPIATFQAVTHRLADQYMTVNAARLTTYAALWELANQKDVSRRIPVAKWYCSDMAQKLADATQHVHGGIGVDVDYPLHRYTLWNKHIETSLGAGTQQLRNLGSQLAAG